MASVCLSSVVTTYQAGWAGRQVALCLVSTLSALFWSLEFRSMSVSPVSDPFGTQPPGHLCRVSLGCPLATLPLNVLRTF